MYQSSFPTSPSPKPTNISGASGNTSDILSNVICFVETFPAISSATIIYVPFDPMLRLYVPSSPKLLILVESLIWSLYTFTEEIPLSFSPSVTVNSNSTLDLYSVLSGSLQSITGGMLSTKNGPTLLRVTQLPALSYNNPSA